jgi:hypothetical protein
MSEFIKLYLEAVESFEEYKSKPKECFIKSLIRVDKMPDKVKHLSQNDYKRTKLYIMQLKMMVNENAKNHSRLIDRHIKLKKLYLENLRYGEDMARLVEKYLDADQSIEDQLNNYKDENKALRRKNKKLLREIENKSRYRDLEEFQEPCEVDPENDEEFQEPCEVDPEKTEIKDFQSVVNFLDAHDLDIMDFTADRDTIRAFFSLRKLRNRKAHPEGIASDGQEVCRILAKYSTE